MYNHLVSPHREVENVTEWAKRESCWKKAQEVDIELSEDVISELISKTEAQEDNRAARKEQKDDNEVMAMKLVAEYGVLKYD